MGDDDLSILREQLREAERHLHAMRSRNADARNSAQIQSTPPRETRLSNIHSAISSTPKSSKVASVKESYMHDDRIDDISSIASASVVGMQQHAPFAYSRGLESNHVPYAILEQRQISPPRSLRTHEEQPRFNDQHVLQAHSKHQISYADDVTLLPKFSPDRSKHSSRDPLLDVVSMLREEVTILKSDVNARDEEVKKLWTQNVELRASLTSSREEKDKIREQYAELSDQLKDLEHRSYILDKSHQECAQLRKLVQANESIIVESSRTIENFEAKTTSNLQKIALLEAQVSSLSKDKSLTESTQAAEYEALSTQYRDLKGEYRRAMEENHDKSKQIQELLAAVSELKTEQSAMKTKQEDNLREQRSKKQEFENAKLQLQQQLATNIKALDEKNTTIAQLQELVQKSSSDIKRVQEGFLDRETEAKRMKTQYEARITALQSEMEAAKRETERHRHDLQHEQTMCKEVSARASSLLQQLSDATDKMQRMERDLHLRDDRILALVAQTEDYSRKLEEEKVNSASIAKNSSITHASQMDDCLRSIDQLNHDKVEMIREKEQLSQQYHQSMQHLQKKTAEDINARDARINDLENELEKALIMIQSFVERDEQQVSEITRLTSMVASYNARAKQLEIGILGLKQQASLGVKPRTTDNDEPQMSFAHSTPIRDKQAAYSSPQLQSQQHSQQQLQNQHLQPNAPIVSTSMRKLDDLLGKVQRDKEADITASIKQPQMLARSHEDSIAQHPESSFSFDGGEGYTLVNALQQQTKYQQRLLESLRTRDVDESN